MEYSIFSCCKIFSFQTTRESLTANYKQDITKSKLDGAVLRNFTDGFP